MHSRLMMFVWRRKILVLGSAVLFLVAIWCWGLFYTSSFSNNGSDKLMTIKDLEIGRTHENLLYKLGLSGFQLRSESSSAENVKFVKPTGETSTKNLRKSMYNHLDSLFLDKKAENLLRNLEMPSRDEIAHRRMLEEVKMAAEKESKYEHDLQRMGIPVIAGLGPGGKAVLPQRIVHFDLKGAPPKITYLKRLLPILKSLGATGLLLEYEDMFPYSGGLSEIPAKNAYSTKEIKELVHSAAAVGLTVMPLVQTFGHLEFALKLKPFRKLREVDESPQSICPSLNSSMLFIEEMLTQVINLHQPSVAKHDATPSLEYNAEQTELLPIFTHIHIGCDEVFRMAECPRCKNHGRNELFLNHVQAVAHLINKRWPELKIVIWDDMLRHMSLSDLQQSQIGSLVEPMIWVYAEDIYRFISAQTWDKYGTVFKTAWVAPAFKGAHGETLMIPPAKRHLENTLRWLAVAQSEGGRFQHGIQGIALTGWQRYDHFAILCEFLPVALPTLALCLSSTAKGYFDNDAKNNPVLSALTCPEPSMDSLSRKPWIDLGKDPNLLTFSRCMFPGSAVFRYVIRLANAIQEIKDDHLETIKYNRGWMTVYNIRHNFSSPTRVDELLQESPRLISILQNLANVAEESMSEIYDKWTITEFIEQRIFPLVDEMKKLEKSGDILKNRRVWPKRPLPYTNDLKKYDLLPKEIERT